MSEEIKKIKLNDAAGNVLHPETEAALVKLTNGLTTVAEMLDSAEAGAQVNKIETVKVNGSALTISEKAVDVDVPITAITVNTQAVTPTNHTVDITIPAQVVYTIEELGTATSGYAKSYQLKADGVAVSGSIINIPKDFLVKSATSDTVKAADKEEGGKFYGNSEYKIGDQYLDFVINTEDLSEQAKHVYVNVAHLVDTYTAGAGLALSNNEFSVDFASAVVDEGETGAEKAVKSKTIFAAIAAAKALKQDVIDSSHKLSADLVDDTNATNKFVTTSEKEAWNAKVTGNAAITAGTATKITYDAKGLVTAGASLAQSDLPVLASYSKALSEAALANGDTIQVALGKLEKALDNRITYTEIPAAEE